MMNHFKWNLDHKTVLPIRLRPKYIEKRDDASIYLGPVKQRNVNKMKTVLINTDNRCNLY